MNTEPTHESHETQNPLKESCEGLMGYVNAIIDLDRQRSGTGVGSMLTASDNFSGRLQALHAESAELMNEALLLQLLELTGEAVIACGTPAQRGSIDDNLEILGQIIEMIGPLHQFVQEIQAKGAKIGAVAGGTLENIGEGGASLQRGWELLDDYLRS